MEPVKQMDIDKKMAANESFEKKPETLESFFESQYQKEVKLEQKYTDFTCNMF